MVLSLGSPILSSLLIRFQLGAGTALPSLVAAACGASVVVSDRHDAPRVLRNIQTTLLSNNPLHWLSDESNI